MYEALKTQEVQQAPLREVWRIEEMAELLLLGEETRAEVEMSAAVVLVLEFAAGREILR